MQPKIGYLVNRTWDDDPEESWSFYTEGNLSRVDARDAKRIVYWEIEDDSTV